MAHSVVPQNTQPCVWMSAGLITYKLCDRDFQCERCPLDAGLRRSTLLAACHRPLLAPSHDAGGFPEDRRYAPGHCWVQAVGEQEDRRWRFGLDAFAATIIGCCGGVRLPASPCTLARGETVCQIDLGLGILSIGSPLPAVVVGRNRALDGEPNRVVTAPYSGGWIVELMTAELSDVDRPPLKDAEAARHGARLDLQRFRRRVALQLLADFGGNGRRLPDGGGLVADLRHMLGGPSYLELVRELVH